MNMDEKSSSNNNDGEKVEDVMLPGFRFHPTDEELVGFYLKKKIQGRPLPIELIKQVDIYKYDPWDLPKFAATGEKEWYFYCPRDRKYRNSARPNRVTGAGFWKATGTDRPIYSSECSKCIGLKKSLVFYRGRAAKGIKTDWMMHEFRLPPIADSNKFLHNNIPPNDSWAICRIFKKTNTMAQRALSHSWAPHFQESITPSRGPHCTTTQLGLEDISCTTEIGPTCFQLFSDTANYLPNTTFFSTPTTVAKSSCFTLPNPNPNPTGDISNGSTFIFDKCTTDTPSTLMSSLPLDNVSKAQESIDFGGSQQFNGFSIGLPQEDLGVGIGMEEEAGSKKNPIGVHIGNQWAGSRSVGFPFNLPWDSPTCPSECFSTNKCYT